MSENKASLEKIVCGQVFLTGVNLCRLKQGVRTV